MSRYEAWRRRGMWALVGCFLLGWSPSSHAAHLPPAATTAPALAGVELPQVTVLPFVGSSLSADARAELDELLMMELGAHHELALISMHDINLLLGVERLRDIAGCDNVSCMAEIVGALGAPYIISGRVQAVAGRVYFNLVLLDMAHSRVLRRAQAVYSDDAYFFRFAMADLVRGLFKNVKGAAPLVLSQTPVADPHDLEAHLRTGTPPPVAATACRLMSCL